MEGLTILILDVGCGDRPEGDVNVDLCIGKTKELFFEDRVINPKQIPNFVRADAHYLPFQDKAFSKVVSNHLIEHLTNPLQALKEFRRVSNGKIEIRIPVKEHEQFQTLFVPKKREYTHKYHKHSFSFKEMQSIFPNCHIKQSYYLLYVLRNLKKLHKTTPNFMKFLFYSFGSTFFPPIPDVLMVTIK